MPRPIEQLNYRDRFVTELPGDPRDDLQVRAVLGACYSRVRPTPVSSPRLLAVVPEVAALLDLEPTPALVEVLAGNRLVPGMAPYSACYGGHQFGSWAGQLGDGRAITLGEVEGAGGQIWEVQLKGAGPTPYSRHADGRAVLRSSLRELVCSEAMCHLGIPTTRALSLVSTGDGVLRDMLYDGHPQREPGAITCRVAPSFLRFGSFELHAARQDTATLAALVRFTQRHYFPELAGELPEAIPLLFAEVCRRTARLVVDWTRVGFVHGVLNTDNMSILGLTIDYGPYGWIEPWDPDWTPNTTDAQFGRYRFGQQGRIALWNLARLGSAWAALLPDPAPLQSALEDTARALTEGFHHMLLAKLGLSAGDPAEDERFLDELLSVLQLAETDMTLFYRRLAHLPADPADPPTHRYDALREAYYADPSDPQRLDAWLLRYLARARHEGVSEPERRRRMDAVNPMYVPRNYLVQQVIERTEQGDDKALAELLEVLRHPYDEQPGREAYAAKRPEWARSRPGCSMLSCSS